MVPGLVLLVVEEVEMLNVIVIRTDGQWRIIIDVHVENTGRYIC